jgi:AcrR family transcriptional regulator
MKTKVATERKSARERLLAAADELFYEEGVNTVGIDRVIERAGVAKASLYDCFGSKDELIRAYLQGRHDAREARITAKLQQYDSPQKKILGLFDALDDVIAKPGFRGCAFVRASAEARSGSGVKDVCEASRGWTLALFTRLLREAGAKGVARRAQQLVLLYDGALVAGHVDGNLGAADAAREVAALILKTAIPGRTK